MRNKLEQIGIVVSPTQLHPVNHRVAKVKDDEIKAWLAIVASKGISFS